jgi:hypothetical protein
VRISGLGRCSCNFRFDPTASIQVKDMCVIKINIALLFASVVVTLYVLDCQVLLTPK